MANMRKALVQLKKTLISPFMANQSSISIVLRLTETQLGFQLGTISRFSDGSGTWIDLSSEESKRRLFDRLLYRSRQQ